MRSLFVQTIDSNDVSRLFSEPRPQAGWLGGEWAVSKVAVVSTTASAEWPALIKHDASASRLNTVGRCVLAVRAGNDLLEQVLEIPIAGVPRWQFDDAGPAASEVRGEELAIRAGIHGQHQPMRVDALAELLQFERAAGALLREVPEVHENGVGAIHQADDSRAPGVGSAAQLAHAIAAVGIPRAARG